MIIWIVIVNGKRVRILELIDLDKPPKEVNVSSLMEEEFTLDQEMETSLANENQGVMQRVSGFLERNQQKGLFDRFIIIAPPDVLCKVRDGLSKEILEVLMLELTTDLMDADASVVRACLPI